MGLPMTWLPKCTDMQRTLHQRAGTRLVVVIGLVAVVHGHPLMINELRDLRIQDLQVLKVA